MERAEQLFEKALSVRPTQVDSLVYLARIRIAQGRTDEAREMLEKALNKEYSAFSTVKRELAVELAASIGLEDPQAGAAADSASPEKA